MKRIVCIVILLSSWLNVEAGELYIGRSSVDITPELPAALMGQFHLRIAEEVSTPLKANIITLETRGNGGDTVVFVSCDLVYIPTQIWEKVRDEVTELLPRIQREKIILSATHTHTSPVLEDESDAPSFLYKLPSNGITKVEDYRTFLVQQISQAIAVAWKERERGMMSWGIRRAAVPYNRRVVYKNGEAVMYGNTNTPEFARIEGYEDHDVQSLFFWNTDGKVLAMSVGVACPAQEVEGDIRIDADYWHPVREKLQREYGSDVVICGWIGAAGDQSPHPIYRKSALKRMRELSQTSRMEDIAQRISEAVIKTYSTVKEDRYEDPILVHEMRTIELPMRKITTEEYIESKRISKDAAKQMEEDPSTTDQLHTRMTWYGDIVKRYEMQKTNPNPQYQTEIHVIRMGDVIVCTNQFELFTDFGIQMQSRSPSLQTLVVQLAGPGTYLPTEKAVRGGGYSAVCQSNSVGPEGGAILVAETLQLMNDVWADR